MKLAIRVFRLLLIPILVAGSVSALVQQQITGAYGRIELAIKQLESSDEGQRAGAKEALVQYGSTAIPSILRLLDEIQRGRLGAREPIRRYATSKEVEGERAYQRYRRAVVDGDVKKQRRAADEFAKLEITSRLQDDACLLLGHLKAAEAIPALIEAMKHEQRFGEMPFWSLPMRSLVQIGTPAVPSLIELIERSPDTMIREARADEDPAEADTAQKLVALRVAGIQKTAAMVLGEIGDARALPILEDLSTRTPFAYMDVQTEIRKIRGKIGERKN